MSGEREWGGGVLALQDKHRTPQKRGVDWVLATPNEVPGSLLRKEAVCRNPNEAGKSENIVRKETMGCATWRSDPKHTGVTWQLPKGRPLNPRDSARRQGLCTGAFPKLTVHWGRRRGEQWDCD